MILVCAGMMFACGGSDDKAKKGKDKKEKKAAVSYKGKWTLDLDEMSKNKPKDEKEAKGYEMMMAMFKDAPPALEIKDKEASMTMSMLGESKTEKLTLKKKDGKTYLYKEGEENPALVSEHSKGKIKLTIKEKGKENTLIFKKK